MQVLAINGSARGGKGVTAKLVGALIQGLEAEGAKVESLQVKGMNIAPCRACLTCMHKTPGVCAQKDDMEQIYPLLKSSDLLVLGAPIYTDSYPAQLKAVLDRFICGMQPYLMNDARGRVRHPLVWQPPRKQVLVSTSSFPEPATFEPLIATFRAQAANFDCEATAELCVPGSLALQMSPPHLEGHLTHLTQAGRELAALGRVTPTTLARVNRPPFSVDEYRRLAGRYEDWCRKTLAG